MEHVNGASALTPRLAGILAAYNELAASGEKPKALDIAKKAKVAGETDKVRSSNVHTALTVLRKKGLLGGAAPAPSPAPKKRRAAAATPKAVEAKPQRTTSRDPTIAALIAKRDEFLKKAQALDVAIEALAVAL